MQNDTRHLKVASEHLRTAYDEVAMAISNPERSMAEAAARRAVRELQMVCTRLEQERMRVDREMLSMVGRADTAARGALQGVFDALNDWERNRAQALGNARDELRTAIDAVNGAQGAVDPEALRAA